MVISLMNPVGGALAQLLSPTVGSPRFSVLILGIITTVVAFAALLLDDKPPSPPTYAGSKTPPPVMETFRSALGLARPEEKDRAMTFQERLDFGILTWGFGILVGVLSAFSILVAQVYGPYGYNSDTSGILGAALFIAGLVGAIITAPLFDRVFTHQLALTLHVVIPIIGGAWLGLAWAVKAHGLVPSYVVLVIAGFGSFMLLPVALELACEVTRSAEFSSSAMWFTANALTVFFVLISDDLRASETANPPANLNKQLILQGACALSLAPLILFIKGKQVRRELDERERLRDEARTANAEAISPPSGSVFIEDLPSQLLSRKSMTEDSKDSSAAETLKVEALVVEENVHYRLYRRRFVGVTALCLLNILGGMSGLWFSAISLDMLNPAGPLPLSIQNLRRLSITNQLAQQHQERHLHRLRIHDTLGATELNATFFSGYLALQCIFAAGVQVISGWLRYAGTAKSLSPNGTFALFLLAQFGTGVSQPFFQTLIPRYSEAWFGLKGRVTATMTMSLMNPVGNAIGQLLSPIGTVRTSILILAIITTVVAPVGFAMGERPPTPPTLAGSKDSPSVSETIRKMSWRERWDFAVLVWGFGVLDGVIEALTTLVAQVYEPYGYDSTQSGFLGAALLIAGIVGAVVTAPLFDRVFTHRLALTVKIIVPSLGVCWLGYIWTVSNEHSLAASYAVLVIVGFASFTLLPVALELGCEVTRNAELSGAVLWLSANFFGLLFVLLSGAFKAGPTANPPYNLRNQLIFHAACALSISPMALFIQGKQVRREMDEQEQARDTAEQAGQATSS
ncbi:hypothetical protein FRB90_001697 [Tulasnella sp. 427]|nr:hypothetical protein FRB90_001697 [Tulasnella sp. 427]